ncbi:MAG TPA: S-layer homology domain-containing protein, partial [Candidatus Peribacteria bacterium]|nr:S-layer homology domain-containing protein [Candidatus Peribacteria bacterium]
MRVTKANALGITVLAIPFFLAASVVFTDTAGSPYAPEIGMLAERGIVEGYADGTFRPDVTINRAEFLKILVESRYADMATPEDLQCFSDLLVRTPQWYARPVCLGRQLGIVGGYPDGRFRPEQTVNLAEALKIATLTFRVKVEAAKPGMPWYEPYVVAARQRGILLNLLGKPDHEVTRGEMASMTAVLLAESDASSSSSAANGTAVCGNDKLETGEQCDDGNMENGDGCSQLCIVVPEPVRLAILQVETMAAGTVGNVAKGKTGVPLLRFNATVDRQDAILTGVVFQTAVGSLTYAQHYTLSMDRDGDGNYETPIQTEGKAQGDRLTFDKLAGTGPGVHLYEGIPVRLQVSADISSTQGPVSLGLRFATDESDYIRATGAVDGIALAGIETDNACPSNVSVCFIRVTTEPNSDITVQERGNLYVTADSLPVRSQQVLGGSISDPLLRLRFRADGEDIDVKKLNIDGGVNSIDSLLLFAVAPGASIDTRSAQPFAQATNTQCASVSATRFCANMSLNMLRLAANQEMTVVVAAKMKDEQAGAASGQSFGLTLSSATDATHAVEARGVSSMADLYQNDGNGLSTGEIFVGTGSPAPSAQLGGAMNDVVLAKISGVENALNQTSVTGIPSGKTTFGGFTLIASPHNNTFHGSNDVIINALVIQVTAQNVQIDPASYRLYNPENPAVGLNCIASQATGNITVTCNGVTGSAIQSRIGQGQQAKYLLEANILNTELSPGASLLTSELSPLGQRNQTNAVTWSDEASSLQWVDIPAL